MVSDLQNVIRTMNIWGNFAAQLPNPDAFSVRAVGLARYTLVINKIRFKWPYLQT